MGGLNLNFCRHCGAKLNEGAVFCGECGKPVQEVKQPSAIESTPTPEGTQDALSGDPISGPANRSSTRRISSSSSEKTDVEKAKGHDYFISVGSSCSFSILFSFEKSHRPGKDVGTL